MNFLNRFGMVGGILGGLATAIPGTIESFAGKAVPTSFVIGLSTFLALPMLSALYLSLPAVNQPGRDRLVSAGYATAMVGTGLFGAAVYTLDIVLVRLDKTALKDTLQGTPRLALLGSILVFVIGTVLFGVSLLRSGRYPRLPVWGYTLALPGLAIGGALPYSPYKGILHVLSGASLIWLALRLPGRSPSAAATQPLLSGATSSTVGVSGPS
jgi:hypothetical protein